MHVDARVLDSALEQFRDEGYTIIRNFIPADEVATLRSETRKLYETAIVHHATYKHGNLTYEILPEAHFGARYVIQAYWFAWASEYFDKFRSHSAYFEILEPLIGRNIKQVTQQIHWKPPGASLTGYRFHQDLRFRESKEAFEDVVRDSVTIGVAIDPATKNNGCLRIVPRSHTNGYLGLSDNGEGSIMKGLTHNDELLAVGLNPDDILDVELEPGDAVVWGLLTVHGSLPNSSANDRAFALSSYVRGETSQRGEWAFKDGVGTRLGPTPQLCKNERLFDNLEPHYDETKWFL
jgi:ectoine hydroxylase-related dioxygenase (phytanoyl-CoA dioxygenase family)